MRADRDNDHRMGSTLFPNVCVIRKTKTTNISRKPSAPSARPVVHVRFVGTFVCLRFRFRLRRGSKRSVQGKETYFIYCYCCCCLYDATLTFDCSRVSKTVVACATIDERGSEKKSIPGSPLLLLPLPPGTETRVNRNTLTYMGSSAR